MHEAKHAAADAAAVVLGGMAAGKITTTAQQDLHYCVCVLTRALFLYAFSWKFIISSDVINPKTVAADAVDHIFFLY